MRKIMIRKMINIEQFMVEQVVVEGMLNKEMSWLKSGFIRVSKTLMLTTSLLSL